MCRGVRGKCEKSESVRSLKRTVVRDLPLPIALMCPQWTKDRWERSCVQEKDLNGVVEESLSVNVDYWMQPNT